MVGVDADNVERLPVLRTPHDQTVRTAADVEDQAAFVIARLREGSDHLRPFRPACFLGRLEPRG